jgi:hypothetical protein
LNFFAEGKSGLNAGDVAACFFRLAGRAVRDCDIYADGALMRGAFESRAPEFDCAAGVAGAGFDDSQVGRDGDVERIARERVFIKRLRFLLATLFLFRQAKGGQQRGVVGQGF